MAITSGFFDSVNGDRTYDAEQMTNYFDGIVSDGVYEHVGEALIVKSAEEGLKVTVGSGRALCKKHWIKNDAPLTLTLSAANVQFPRRDRIVIRWDSNERKVDIVVLEGTPSASAAPPTISRTETTWDMILAEIYINANVTIINQSNISDLRPSSYCGWVTGVIKQVNTSQLFLQYQNAYKNQYAAFDRYFAQKQADFDAWFSSLTEQLRVDTTLHEYQNTYKITESQALNKLYPIGISEYEPDKDILLVTVDGITLTLGVDFQVMKFSEHYPDISGTGKIDAGDATTIMTAYANISTGQPSGLTEEQEKAADANMDGKIDPSDSTLVLNFYSEASVGRYTNDVEGWTEFLETTMTMTLDSEYYIVPISTRYRQGSQMTIRVLKSVIGEGSGGGTKPAYARALVDALRSETGTTTYEADYPANLCEVVSDYRDSVTFKPQSKPCLLLASFNIKASDLSEFINTMETQGWNSLINVPMYTNSDDSTTITWYLTMFTRQSNGGTVQILNSSTGFSQHSHLMVLYGATSVDVVQAGNLPYDVTYSYTDVSDGNDYTLVGFETLPQTNKYRVYANERNTWGGDQVNFCTKKSEIPTEGEPPNYTPTVLDTDAGSTMLTGNGTLSFDANLNSSGIVWWGAKGKNPSPDWEPMIKSKTYATVVLDVNYT